VRSGERSTAPVSAMRPLSDRHYWAALGAGPSVWCVLACTIGAGEHWPALPMPWRDYLTLSLLYPVVEELVFRGWLQGALRRYPGGRRRFGPVSCANLVTSIVFAGAHLFSHPPLAALLVLFPSLIFGHFRDCYGRVAPSMGLHGFYNSGYFWLFG
jgi:membrane protease YdiL (CAAX protease family)